MEDLQVKVISFSQSPPLLATLRRLFPQISVEVQTAVDVRGLDTETLIASNVIGHAAANSITHGRRWHHEMPTKGAVGLAQAVRLALLDDVNKNLLLFEEDCNIKDERKLIAYVEKLVRNASKFDLAVLGLLHKQQVEDVHVDVLPGWIHIKDMFWGLHCALYSAEARKKVAATLESGLDMQIDSLYGSMAKNNLLKIWAQKKDPCVEQHLHISSIQGSTGLLRPQSGVLFTGVITSVAAVIIVLAVAVVLLTFRMRRAASHK